MNILVMTFYVFPLFSQVDTHDFQLVTVQFSLVCTRHRRERWHNLLTCYRGLLKHRITFIKDSLFLLPRELNGFLFRMHVPWFSYKSWQEVAYMKELPENVEAFDIFFFCYKKTIKTLEHSQPHCPKC